jgi:hypothetical protein
MASKTLPGDESLKRLGGGRWQTRDERFTIEPQSGTWAVVDAEQTDDLGLPLVRGPFGSLTAAKAAIATARESEPATSPLVDRLRGRDRGGTGPNRRDPATPVKDSKRDAAPHDRDRAGSEDEEAPRDQPKRRESAKRTAASRSDEPSEPGWMRELEPSNRGRARRLIKRLEDAGISDAEGIVRRDLAGGVAAIASVAVGRRLAELGPDAAVAKVVAVLAEGKDDDLDVRWRIVDGDGRPILVEPPGRPRRR